MLLVVLSESAPKATVSSYFFGLVCSEAVRDLVVAAESSSDQKLRYEDIYTVVLEFLA